MKSIMLKETSEECCAFFFGDSPCEVYDRGCGRPCVSLGWHANIHTQDGCTDDDECKSQVLLVLYFSFHWRYK